MDRASGLSVRLKLTLRVYGRLRMLMPSRTVRLRLTLLYSVWLFLLRYVPRCSRLPT